MDEFLAIRMRYMEELRRSEFMQAQIAAYVIAANSSSENSSMSVEQFMPSLRGKRLRLAVAEMIEQREAAEVPKIDSQIQNNQAAQWREFMQVAGSKPDSHGQQGHVTVVPYAEEYVVIPLPDGGFAVLPPEEQK